MDWLYFSLFAVIVVELGLLYFCYKYVFSNLNADAWEKKVTQNDSAWLLQILAPVIDETCTRILATAPKELTKVLKGELLASQGSLSRAVLSDQGEPADMMLGLSTVILQQLGYKNVNPLMATKLASILGGIVDKIGETDEKESDAPPQMADGLLYDEPLY